LTELEFADFEVSMHLCHFLYNLVETVSPGKE